MWTWSQSTGALSRDGTVLARGYSGRDAGKNNPAMEAVRGVGPIPQGKWKIGAPYDSKSVGPYAMRLTAIDARPDDDVHQGTGRSAFRIHGDSIAHPGTASRGCIILPRAVRRQIWMSGDRELLVVA